jgi:cysteine desulfurase / selenocysteine lyase
MRDYSCDFSLTPGHVWLNAASEGPIPNVSAAALQEAIGWKLSPHQLTIPKFQQIPIELKQSLADFINVPADEIILGNSATYGLHLLANGLSLGAGDEVVLMRNDFPTDILPWLHLKNKGVMVQQIKAAEEVLTFKEVKDALTSKTKVVCLPYVHTFSGRVLDIVAIGDLCRQRGILFVVNMSQAVGAFEVNMAGLPVDAIVCAGYKWLLGPYSTGFCWIKKAVRESLNYPQAYWISLMDEQSLSSTGEIVLKEDKSARRYDVFATANFFNYVPWQASIKYLSGIGIKEIAHHNGLLVDQIVDGIKNTEFKCISPTESYQRTNIVVFSFKDGTENGSIFEFLKGQGFYVALWKGKLRVSPHIYNTQDDIKRFLCALHAYAK